MRLSITRELQRKIAFFTAVNHNYDDNQRTLIKKETNNMENETIG